MRVVSAIALVCAVLVHSVTAWIFGLQQGREMWHTALLGPWFVSSALVCGVALVLVVVIALRKAGYLELAQEHVVKMLKLLGVVVMVDLYFFGCDLLTEMCIRDRFWMVFSAKKACVEVEDYSAAVAWVAQTAMRKAIGRATVAEVAMRRDQLDAELKDAIEEKLSPWGIDIIDVEVRDIVVPKELQEAMAMEAVAERKKNARMVLAEAEKDISEMLKDASEVYAGDQDAMKLRTMHLAYESVEQSGGTLVIPSAFSEGFAPETGGAATAGRPAAGE